MNIGLDAIHHLQVVYNYSWHACSSLQSKLTASACSKLASSKAVGIVPPVGADVDTIA